MKKSSAYLSIGGGGGSNSNLSTSSLSERTKEIIHAIRENNLDKVKVLLQDITLLHVTDDREETPLHHASRSWNELIIKFLLEKGADINARNWTGRTPLHTSVDSVKETPNATDCIKTATLLLNRGANLYTVSHTGYTLLHDIASNRQLWTLDVMKWLVKKGLDINARTDDGSTPLILSIYNSTGYDREHYDKIEWLLTIGADATITDNSGRTPLHYAAFNKGFLPEKLPLLLKTHGVDINATDNNGMTALHYAAHNGNSLAVTTLLFYNADYTIKDKSGLTPFEHASSEIAEIVSQPHKYRASAQAQKKLDDDLIKAVWKNDMNSVVKSLRSGADVNAATLRGHTPLSIASSSGYEDLVQLFLAWGADVNAKTDSGNTALHEAVYDNRTSIVNLLLNAGADVNAENDNGQLPIWYAYANHAFDVVKMLINKGNSRAYLENALDRKITEY